MPAKDAPLVLLVCGRANDRTAERVQSAKPAIVIDATAGLHSVGDGWVAGFDADLFMAPYDNALRLAMLIADRWDHDEMRVGVLALPGAGEICKLAEDAGVTVWRPEGE